MSEVLTIADLTQFVLQGTGDNDAPAADAVVHLCAQYYPYAPIWNVLYEPSPDGPGVVLLQLDSESDVAKTLHSMSDHDGPIRSPIRSQHVQTIHVVDPDTGNLCPVEIRKLEGGPLVGFDGSYLEQLDDDEQPHSPYDPRVQVHVPDNEFVESRNWHDNGVQFPRL
ncbi:MAG: hypothetical protein ACYTBZ_29080, partial [Planctomycetota bacterium]